MNLKEYITRIIQEFTEAEGNEIAGNKQISFEVGIATHNDRLVVSDISVNRVKFTLEVKRL